MRKYDHRKIERKWQKKWAEEEIYRANDNSKKPKFYCLGMFPYPSGEGLHVGHPRSFTATDIISRFKRMNGYNVLHPMGWDAFGLPAENFALKNKISPQVSVKKNIKRFKSQIRALGLGYDWSREIDTTDPDYYAWTQWIFLKMYKQGLAYESHEPINWCPSCKTGLANEDLENGRCERCDSEIEQKPLRQWVLKITDYAEELLAGLEDLEWPESIKELQRNWIGKSEGVEINFQLTGEQVDEDLKVFTTRPDTLFGASYVVLAPEHPLMEQLKSRAKNSAAVKRYITRAAKKTELERLAEGRTKTGVELQGVEVINPANGEKLPVFVADYVMAHYGTGSIMAVPAHDERDHEFACKYNLPIKRVIANSERARSIVWGRDISKEDIDSIEGEILEEVEAQNQEYQEVVKKIEFPAGKAQEFEELLKKKMPRGFWNEYVGPNGIIFNFKGSNGKMIKYVLSEENESQIDRKCYQFFHEEEPGPDWQPKNVWKWLTEAENGFYKDFIIHTEGGKLENSGKFNGLDSEKAKEAIRKEVGGKKRVTYKLRDWVFSRQRYWGEPIPLVHCEDCGVVPVPEDELPVKLPKVKSYEPTGTGQSPLANISNWVNTKCPECGGAAERETNTMPQWAGSCWYYLAYAMHGSLFPRQSGRKPRWSQKQENYWLGSRDNKAGGVDMYVGGVEHATRHLIYARFWHRFLYDQGLVSSKEPFRQLKNQGMIYGEDNRKMSKRWGNIINPDEVVRDLGADTMRVYEMFMGPFENDTAWSTDNILGVRRFLERVWRMSQLVKSGVKPENKDAVLLNRTIKQVTENIESFSFNTAISALMILSNRFGERGEINRNEYLTFLQLLAPFAPHISEELWSHHRSSGIHLSRWPQYDPDKLVEDTVNIAVQVNGKLRAELKIDRGADRETVLHQAAEKPEVAKWIKGRSAVKKEIYIPDRLVNFVTAH